MSDLRLVLCGGAAPEAAPSGADTLVLDLQGAKPNVFLQISDLSEAMARNVPDILTDLLDVAVYVFAADQGTSRGGPRDTGDKWRRRFRFHIPLRNDVEATLRDPILSIAHWSRRPTLSVFVSPLSRLLRNRVVRERPMDVCGRVALRYTDRECHAVPPAACALAHECMLHAFRYPSKISRARADVAVRPFDT